MHLRGPAQELQIAGDTICVHDIDLRLGRESLEQLADLLDESERTQAERFVTRELARKYIVSHGGARIVLGCYLGVGPEEVRFVRNAHGKPALDLAHASELRFNLSHSGERCLVAVTESREIGVDIEAVRPIPDWPEIATRFFSPGEVAGLRSLPEALLGTAFFATWSRKEAYIKAVGLGFAIDLATFQVEVDPRRPARLIFAADADQGPDRWCMQDIDVGPDYRAAVAVEGSGCIVSVNVHQWPLAPRVDASCPGSAV